MFYLNVYQTPRVGKFENRLDLYIGICFFKINNEEYVKDNTLKKKLKQCQIGPNNVPTKCVFINRVFTLL